jgi:hypothetical protein
MGIFYYPTTIKALWTNSIGQGRVGLNNIVNLPFRLANPRIVTPMGFNKLFGKFYADEILLDMTISTRDDKGIDQIWNLG